jgi:hypothetical protein
MRDKLLPVGLIGSSLGVMYWVHPVVTLGSVLCALSLAFAGVYLLVGDGNEDR